MSSYQTYYAQLNKEQREAVDLLDGPVLVLAGPGTGKTQLLSVRAANIIRQNRCPPDAILILTYTNAATKAMRERLGRIMGPAGYAVNVDTFHGFANAIIRDSEELTEYINKRIQISDVEREQAFEHILDRGEGVSALRPFGNPYFYVRDIQAAIRDLKNEGVLPEMFESAVDALTAGKNGLEEKHLERLWALSRCYRLYEDLKQGATPGVFDERGRYDFDDMIVIALRAIEREATLRGSLREQYRFIMIDEFQDTNGAQMKLLFSLLPDGAANICCVGDDDQSIYRFQGASAANFALFEKAFPSVKRITLRANYRSPGALIGLSSKIIGGIPAAERSVVKDLVPAHTERSCTVEAYQFTAPEEELSFLIEKVRRLKETIAADRTLQAAERERPYNAIAVLVRKRKSIPALIDAFLRAGIPYSTDGKENILAERRVMQLIDALELAAADSGAVKESDLLLYRVLTSDYLAVPHADVLAFIHLVQRTADRYTVSLLSEFLARFPADPTGPPPVREHTQGLAVLGACRFLDPEALHRAAYYVARLRQDAHARPVHYILLQFIEDVGLYRYILRNYDDRKVVRVRDLRALTAFITMVKSADLARPGMRLADFLDELDTRRTHNLPVTGELVSASQDGVRIITAHGAKGMEFHTVMIPFCLQDANWPARPQPEKIPLPRELFPGMVHRSDKERLKQLSAYDETRLFYVAASRAKTHLCFTVTPTDKNVPSLFFDRMGIDVVPYTVPDEESLLAATIATSAEQDPFIGTDEILRDVIRNLKLTPTKVNHYLSCHRKFLYNDVLLLPGKKKQSLIFGNCAHKAAEEVYRQYMRTGAFPDKKLFRQTFLRELGFQGADSPTYRSCSNKYEQYLDKWFDHVAAGPVMPLGLESRLITTIGENIDFVGKYDKIERADADGAVRVIDYKSGKPDPHIKKISACKDVASEQCDEYFRQLVAYKLLFDRDAKENKGRRVRYGVLVFFEPVRETVRKYDMQEGRFQELSVPITDDMVASLEALIIRCWRQIMDLHFEKLPAFDKEKCASCDYRSLCWNEAVPRE